MALERVTDVVDCHHHLWGTKTHPWLQSVAETGHCAGPFRTILEYGVEDYMADAQSFNVSKSVHVQAHYSGQPVEETKWLQEIADKYGYPHGIVAYADLSQPDADSVLEQHRQYANVRGIRQMLDYHPTNSEWRQAPHDKFMTDDAWLNGLGLLQKHGLSFDIQLHVPQLQVASDVVRSHPDIQFVLNHAAFPTDLSDDGMKGWTEGLTALSRHDNIAVKMSGFNMFHHDWNKELLSPLIDTLIRVFSADRCMFASNFPVDKVNGGYSQLMSTYFDVCSDIGMSQDAVTKMFRDNALRIYKL